jgi:hypothetical protein
MRQRRLILIPGVVVLVVVLVLISSYYSGGSSTPATSDTTTATTFTYNTNPLTNNSVSSQQASALKQVLNQYLTSQNVSSSDVGFTQIKLTPTSPTQVGAFSQTKFIIQLNGKNSYEAVLDAYSLTEIRLYIYDLSGKNLLYDSQDVGASSE